MKTPYRTNAPPPKYVDELPPRTSTKQRASAFVIGGMLSLLVCLIPACSWFQANAPYFPTPADVSCVYSAVESGVQDPAGIIAACPALAALAIEDLIKLISGIVLGKAHRIEMEKAKAAAHTSTGVPLYVIDGGASSPAAVSVSGPPVHVIVTDGGTK